MYERKDTIRFFYPNGDAVTFLINGKPYVEVPLDDASYLYEKREDIPELSLRFTTNEYVALPLQTWVNYRGSVFYIFFQPAIEKVHDNKFVYSCMLYPLGFKLKQQLVTDPTGIMGPKFALCGTPTELLQTVVGSQFNIAVDDELLTYNILMEFDYQYRFDALKALAKQLHTSFNINGDNVFLGDTDTQTSITLQYGRGKGLLGDIKSDTSEKFAPLNRLYIKGTTRNMPLNCTLQPQEGTQTTLNKETYTFKDGAVICGNNSPSDPSEKTIDLTGIYPHRIGFVSAVANIQRAVDDVTTDCVGKITDTSIPAELNYNDYLTDEEMTLMFQDGELSGHEFKVSEYDHATKTFTIEPEYVDGQLMLAGTFVPKVGDAYIIFHCDVPQSYITEARNKLFQTAVKYLAESRKQQFNLTAKVDNNWLVVSQKDLACNDLVTIVDKDLCPQGVELRVEAVKRKCTEWNDELTLATIDNRDNILDVSRTIYEEIATMKQTQ